MEIFQSWWQAWLTLKAVYVEYPTPNRPAQQPISPTLSQDFTFLNPAYLSASWR